jgi:hypothetical protein
MYIYVYLQNVLQDTVKTSKQNTHAVKEWIQNLNTESDTWVRVLVSEDTQRVLKRSDLDKVLELVEVLPTDLVASEQHGLSSERMSSVLRTFYASLFSTSAPQFERLQDPDVRELARSRTARHVADSYALVSKFIYILSSKAYFIYHITYLWL